MTPYRLQYQLWGVIAVLTGAICLLLGAPIPGWVLAPYYGGAG